MQRRLTFAIKNAWLLPDGCGSHRDKDNEILFTISISPPLTTIAGLDVADLWLGLPGYRTSQQCTSSYGATLKVGDSEEDIIALLLRLRQPSGSNQGFLNAHVSLCCFVVGFVSRLGPYVWTCALNWYEIQLSFGIL